MRIIGGQARGRQIRLPAGCRIRPTADRVKESLFNILHPVEGTSFLDIFAGCGNVGLEALSRGARGSVFVEKDLRLVEAIRENLRLLGFEGQGEVIAAGAQQGLRRLGKRGERFDILFADPPYDEDFLPEILKCLEGAELLAENGIIVLQHSVREDPKESLTRTLVMTDQRRYGDTLLSFLKKSTEEPNL
ncbi:MAG: 16S rRNA (guanine(966)-N(2))-methyltransferase RsmD [Syntrophales bacterium]|nr:16S rRNA (guanine(966)-N(2))-methyltransferase RsmD [Syntrophales bacterium]